MRTFFSIMLAGGMLVSMSFADAPKPDNAKPVAAKPAAQPDKDFAMNVEKIPFQTIKGDTTTLAAYAGKVVLIVNVASKCGHTPQYEGLEKLYETYKDSGLVILGFPANNFGEQEPGTNAEILQFCQTTYNVKFPMMAKVSVLGEDKHPLFVELTDKSTIPGDITWNFSKFLIDRKGDLVARFGPKIEPTDTAFVATIKSVLKS